MVYVFHVLSVLLDTCRGSEEKEVRLYITENLAIEEYL